jgi:hypothetical protein
MAKAYTHHPTCGVNLAITPGDAPLPSCERKREREREKAVSLSLSLFRFYLLF